jgi:hypothetical protein
MGTAAWIWLPLFNTGVIALVILGFVILFIPHTANNASLPATFAHAFPPEVRYSGLAVGYNLGTLIASAVSPLVAAWLFEATGSWTSIALYITAGNVVSLIAAFFVRERFSDPVAEPVASRADGVDEATLAH